MIVLTHAYFIHEDEVELKIMKPYVPLGILYLSAFLEDNEVSNLVFDSTFNSKETWKAYMTKNKPSIIAFYTNLITRLNVLELIQWVKVQLPECKIVLGGPEVKHHAAEFLNNGAHIIAIGEGEQTMLELYHTLTGGGNLTDVNGIAFLQNNEIVFTNARALIKDIDALPVPNRKKVSIQLYLDAWKNTHGYSTISLSTMRGCPYSCKWCSRAVYGQSYRRRSPQHVINEIKHLKLNYQFDRIWFVDDVFTISHKWLEEFTQLIKQQNITISFECITRADRMNHHVLELLRNAGCFRVWIGAESGSQEIIDAMDRRVDVNVVRDMIKSCKQYGIASGTFIMVGYPGEKLTHIDETIAHLLDCEPDFFTITLAYPIKGTPLYAEVEPHMITDKAWHERTDRMLDFKRSHPRKFYHYAIRHIYNSVAYQQQSKKSGAWLRKNKLFLKVKATRLAMKWYSSTK